MPKMSWDSAIRKVLAEANAALHYTEISDRIIDQKLVRSIGATPAQTVASVLSTSIRNDVEQSPFQRVGRGEYILREARGEAQSSPASDQNEGAALSAENEAEDEAGALQAFGMYWRRDTVLWDRTVPHIFGRQNEGARRVDFGSQIGVYLLHDRDRVIYVGRAADALSKRLRAHTINRLGGRWDRFSWFGLRSVTDSGTLADGNMPRWSHGVVIETMEALLIESLEPTLNRKRGDNFQAVEFLQADDPEMERKKKEDFLDALKSKL